MNTDGERLELIRFIATATNDDPILGRMADLLTATKQKVVHGPKRGETRFAFHGPYFSVAEAAAYVGRPNVRAFYEWRRRRAAEGRPIPVMGDGTIAKRDLDRVKDRRRAPRGKAATPHTPSSPPNATQR